MNADEYVMGKISLDEFIRREEEANFSITIEEWNAMGLVEQNELYRKHPEKIRALLGGQV